MAILINGNNVAADNWQRLDVDGGRWLRPGEDGRVPEFPPDADLIAPVELWRVRRTDLLERRGRAGLWLEPHDDPAEFVDDLARLALIVVHFPHFTDGRGYSIARVLRERYGYRGELRAAGDVLRDQIFYLSRCGFDAFALRDDQDPALALAALNDFGDAYQTSVERPVPLFRRRAAEGRAQ